MSDRWLHGHIAVSLSNPLHAEILRAYEKVYAVIKRNGTLRAIFQKYNLPSAL